MAVTTLLKPRPAPAPYTVDTVPEHYPTPSNHIEDAVHPPSDGGCHCYVLLCGGPSEHRATCYRLASTTRLNGVFVAIRNLEKPLLVTTSSNAPGPAWAPSDSPPAWLKAEGTQTAVERA